MAMRLVLGAVGRLKAGPERALFERYWQRLAATGRLIGLGPLQLFEVPEGRASSAAARTADEAGRLLTGCAGAPFIATLEERGQAMSSAALARLVRDRRDGGAAGMVFLIGGPDGHGRAALSAAQLKLSLGPMTLPHGLARIVLAEQLYRAATLIAGHPYHRQ